MSNLAIYGNREDVLDLTKRLQATIPGGRKLSQEEALSLAQISVAHGLDPFNGEAWIIPGSGLMVGIKGLRKAARRAADAENGVFWSDFQLVPAADYDAPEDAIVYECRLRDTVTTQAWAKAVNIMTTAGVPYKEEAQMAGPAPVIIGIGIATTKESSKMPIHQRARKRAEADAIKQRYDVALYGTGFSAEEPDIVEATFSEDDNAEPREEETIIQELGYDVEPEADDDYNRQNESHIIHQAVVDANLSENVHAAKNALQTYCTTGYDTSDKAVAWMKLYRGWRDAGKTAPQSAAKANNGEAPK
jgi:hypothetical protein